MVAKLQLKKLLRTKGIIEKGNRPFMVNSDDIVPMKLEKVSEIKNHIIFEGSNVNNDEPLKITRSWVPHNTQDDPSRKIKDRLQSGALILFQDVQDNNLGLDSNISSCSRFSIISYGKDNAEILQNRNILVKPSYLTYQSGRNIRQQKYFDIESNKSKKVNSAKDALIKIKNSLQYDGKKGRNTFALRGFSPDENLSISVLFDNFADGVEPKDFMEKTLENFFDENQSYDVEIISVEPVIKKMTGKEILELIDQTKDSAIWEVIPARCYVKSLTPKDNVKLEVQLNTHADIYEQSYKYDNNIQGCVNSTIGFLDKPTSNGGTYRNIVALFHDDITPTPLSLIKTPFVYPAKELGFVDEPKELEIESTIPEGVNLVSFALSLDEDYEQEKIQDKSLSSNFDFIKQFSHEKIFEQDQNIENDSLNDSSKDLTSIKSLYKYSYSSNETSTELNKKSFEGEDYFDKILKTFYQETISSSEPNDNNDEDFPEEIDINSIGTNNSDDDFPDEVDFNDIRQENVEQDDFPEEIDLSDIGNKGLEEENFKNNVPDIETNENQPKPQEKVLTRSEIEQIPHQLKDGIGNFMLRKLEKVKIEKDNIVMTFCDPISESKRNKAARNFGISSSDIETVDVNTYKFNSMQHVISFFISETKNLATEEYKSFEDNKEKNEDDAMKIFKNNFDTIASNLGM
jgi:hypothetical protein